MQTFLAITEILSQYSNLKQKTNQLLLNLINDGTLKNFKKITIKNPENKPMFLESFLIKNEEVYFNLISADFKETEQIKYNNYDIPFVLHVIEVIRNQKKYN